LLQYRNKVSAFRRVDRTFTVCRPTVGVMRRTLLLPLLALTVLAAGCNSGSTTKQTVTVVNTVTSSAAGAALPSGSVVVAAPSGSTPPQTTAAQSSAQSSANPPAGKPTSTPTLTTASPSTAPSTAPIVKVDPLKSDCSSLLDPTDVKKAIGATVAQGSSRKKDVPNAGRGITGKIRCYYPKADAKGTAPMVIALTQYTSAAAAAKQIQVTVDTESEKGARISETKVNGYPAHLLLRSGGLVNVQYGTWTLAIAVADRVASDAVITDGLPILAGQVLMRVIKNA